MAGIAVIATFLAFLAAASAEGVSPSEYGMTKSNDAITAVCWYENLKQFPKTDSRGYGRCGGASEVLKQLKDMGMPDESLVGSYAGSMDMILNELPSVYTSKCKKHLDSTSASTSDDESDALNDGGHEYPFRAFAYCLLKTLRSQHGDEAIEAVKNERTHSLKHWRDTIHERENEFRKLHGAGELQLVQELIDRAQRWSEKSAAACDDQHIPKTHPEYLFQDKPTGENLAANGGPDDGGMNAYSAVDGWYEEIANYPFPQGVDNSDGGNGVIGHFTQTVWSGSQYVGYGYAYNPNCSPYTSFITARYWPAGNMGGAFRDNVKPPQH